MTRARDVATQGGLVLLNTTNFTTASSISVNNCFSAAYPNYLVMLSISSASAYSDVFMRMRVNGTDNSSNNYRWYQEYKLYGNTGGSSASTTSSTNAMYMFSTNTDGMSISQTVYSPFANAKTVAYGQVSEFGYAGNVYNHMSVTTSYDGLTIYLGTGNMTGSLKIYGMK